MYSQQAAETLYLKPNHSTSFFQKYSFSQYERKIPPLNHTIQRTLYDLTTGLDELLTKLELEMNLTTTSESESESETIKGTAESNEKTAEEGQEGSPKEAQGESRDKETSLSKKRSETVVEDSTEWTRKALLRRQQEVKERQENRMKEEERRLANGGAPYPEIDRDPVRRQARLKAEEEAKEAEKKRRAEARAMSGNVGGGPGLNEDGVCSPQVITIYKDG
jgi:hypothetical protein